MPLAFFLKAAAGAAIRTALLIGLAVFVFGGAAQAAPATHIVITGPNPLGSYITYEFDYAALDASGNVDTTYNGTVALTSSDPLFANLGNVTFSNGIGIENGVLKTAGTQTITATDIANPDITGTASFTVVPGPAQYIGVSVPANATAGTPISFTVTAYDLVFNVATSYGGTVHFTNTDRYGIVPADSTITNGVGTFTATLGTVGSQTITATDATNSLAGTSGGIAVSNGPAALFGFRVRPTTAVSGAAFSVNLLALDIYGNLASNYTGTVHFTSSDPSAALPTNTTLSSGQGSFSATLYALGNQSITATDSVTSSITNTQAVTVTTPPALRLRVSTAAAATSGTPDTVTVTALDASGNTARGYTGTVHFTSSAADATLPVDTTLVNGVGSFPVTFKAVGHYSVTATDTATSSITGTSGSVNVTAGAATQLKATAQSSAVVNRQFGVVVQALDAYGNVATGYTGTIHLTSTDPNAVLPANGVLYSGQRTFLVTLKTVGSQTVTATDTVNSAFTATTGAVTITAH
jgi:hypothetical protein